MKKNHIGILALAVLSTLLIAGCGSNDDVLFDLHQKSIECKMNGGDYFFLDFPDVHNAYVVRTGCLDSNDIVDAVCPDYCADIEAINNTTTMNNESSNTSA